MKKLLKIIIAVIFIQTTCYSQDLFKVPTQFRLSDSTLVFNTNLFDLTNPLKANLNGFNAVLISETQMDSINLKYLKFNVLSSKIHSLELNLDLRQNELDQALLKNDQLTTDNQRLSLINSLNKKQMDNDKIIHDNEILYYKEKAKGKFTSFLLGTSVGALIITILTLIN